MKSKKSCKELIQIAKNYLGFIKSEYETSEGVIGGGMKNEYNRVVRVITKVEGK